MATTVTETVRDELITTYRTLVEALRDASWHIQTTEYGTGFTQCTAPIEYPSRGEVVITARNAETGTRQVVGTAAFTITRDVTQTMTGNQLEARVSSLVAAWRWETLTELGIDTDRDAPEDWV